MKQNNTVVCIEGNIGSGKSSVLDILHIKGYKVLPEPVDEWQELLEKYYNEPGRWGFALQMKTLASMVKNSDASNCIIERSILSCRNVFGQLMFNNGHLSEKEWTLYKKYCDFVMWEPSVIIYIDTSPAICLSRIQERDRTGESQIDIDYLTRIEFQYSNMLKFFNGKVFTVDGSRSHEEVAEEIEAIINTQSIVEKDGE